MNDGRWYVTHCDSNKKAICEKAPSVKINPDDENGCGGDDWIEFSDPISKRTYWNGFNLRAY